MTDATDPSGRAACLAALSICEALALTMAEHGVLPRQQICAAIDDAVAAHRDAATESPDREAHYQAARLADRIRASIAAGSDEMLK